jgi:hypothetical protein
LLDQATVIPWILFVGALLEIIEVRSLASRLACMASRGLSDFSNWTMFWMDFGIEGGLSFSFGQV